MRKPQIKTFKRFIKEDAEKWYSLDLYSEMDQESILFNMNLLLPIIIKMLKNSDVTITVEPVLESKEE